MTVQQVKQRFGLIGNAAGLNRALEIAIQVAPTDISVLVRGESGTGKEIIPQIIHQLSTRKHNEYIAINCGAIPEGTIDSELFGHEKGAFTGATGSRKGYFEVADGGTIFLDEVGELPLSTQVRLLRVLETGEFIKVGSSKIEKTNVRIIAATHRDLKNEIRKGKFREDLYYRLNTVPIFLPPLRDRGKDISLLFRKFAVDFAEKYRMPALRLDEAANNLIEKYRWPGNIRQLKNIAEQVSVIEKERNIVPDILFKYLPHDSKEALPMVIPNAMDELSPLEGMSLNEIEQVIFELKKDINDLKRLMFGLIQNRDTAVRSEEGVLLPDPMQSKASTYNQEAADVYDAEEVEESLSLEDSEKELIKRALQKHQGKRKYAAQELGISERTLYRKIKEFKIED